MLSDKDRSDIEKYRTKLARYWKILSFLEDPVSLVSSIFEDAHITVDMLGNFIKGENFYYTSLENDVHIGVMKLVLEAKQINRSIGSMYRAETSKKLPIVVKPARVEVLDAIGHLRDILREQARVDLVNDLAFTGETLDPALDIIESWTGERNEVHALMLKHWGCGVIRNLRNLPVSESRYYKPYMIVLQGKQGAGKSVGIGALTEVFGSSVMRIELDQISDSGTLAKLCDSLVVDCDEMAGAQKADMNRLKKLITANFESFRVPYEKYSANFKMKASFIGSSNESVQYIIRDYTGMRRFYEIKVLDKFDYTAVNNIDYRAFWRSIDHNLESGYIKGQVELEVSEAQKELMPDDELSNFLDDIGLTGPGEGKLKFVPSSALIQAFVGYLEGLGYDDKNRPSVHPGVMKKKLKSMGVKYHRTKKHRGYFVDECVTIDGLSEDQL